MERSCDAPAEYRRQYSHSIDLERCIVETVYNVEVANEDVNLTAKLGISEGQATESRSLEDLLAILRYRGSSQLGHHSEGDGR